MAVDLQTKVGSLTLRNPLIAASGTYGFGREMKRFYPARLLGGVVSKAVTLEPRSGNAPHRIAEAEAGLLNAVGLQNPGIAKVLEHDLPFLLQQEATVIVNVAGSEPADYVNVVERLQGSGIAAIELNLSCPNVKAGGMAMGTSAQAIEQVTAACKRVADVPLWVKLTPNVTSIGDMAKAAEAGGADAVSLINTLLAMRIDIRTKRPIIKNNTGGYSGPGVFPVAVRMVHDCYRAVAIPIVGLGGIRSASDVIEMMLAGASAVQIGSANLVDPYAMVSILDDLPALCAELGINKLTDIVGAVKRW